MTEKVIESLTYKENRILEVMKKWVKGELSTHEADKELEKAGVELQKGSNERKMS